MATAVRRLAFISENILPIVPRARVTKPKGKKQVATGAELLASSVIQTKEVVPGHLGELLWQQTKGLGRRRDSLVGALQNLSSSFHY